MIMLRETAAIFFALTLLCQAQFNPNPVKLNIESSGNDVVIQWPSSPGGVYNVFAGDTLSTSLTTNRVQATSTVSQIQEPATNTIRTYRVESEAVPVASGAVATDTIAQIESIAGLTFTSTQRSQILQILQGGWPGFVDGQFMSLAGLAGVRSVPLVNNDRPALIFDPRPTGFTVDLNQQSIQWGPVPNVTVPTNFEDVAFYSVRQLSELIRTGQITSLQLTQLYLDRLKRYGPVLNCVITLTESLALQQAQEADAEIANGNYRGPLHGIPYGLKDLFAVKNYPTTWGAAPYQDQVFEYDAAVQQRLHEAGAILVAKLSTGALAWGDTWFGGQTKNPWDTNNSSGGSSAGPAAATAAGLVAFSIGTETMGSISDPIALCRVTGLRSSFGRVSREGCMALAWSMDQVGPISRSAEDCAIVLNAIRTTDPADRDSVNAAFNYDATRSFAGTRVGYVPGTLSQTESNRFVSMGATLIPLSLPDAPAGGMLSIMMVEAAAAFDQLTRSGGLDLLNANGTYQIPNFIRTARTVLAVDYLQADRIRRKLVDEFEAIFSTVDLYVRPYALDSKLAMANLCGLPCVSIPLGGSDSLLLVGPLYGEATILEAAKAYQEAAGYSYHGPVAFRD